MKKIILTAVALAFTFGCVSQQDIETKNEMLGKYFYGKHSSEAFAVWGYPEQSQKLSTGRLYTWNKADPVYTHDLKTGTKTLTRTDHCNIKLFATQDDIIENFTMDGKSPDGTVNNYSCMQYKRALEKHIEGLGGMPFNSDAISNTSI